jgi:folate-binding protein YgfZ
MQKKTVLSQYNSVKENFGLLDFSIEGKIIVKGGKRVDFINGLVTNDIAGLRNFHGCYASFLDNNGKILSDSIVYRFADFLLLNMSIVGKSNIIGKLKNEAGLGKSVVEDSTLNYGLFSFQGPKSTEFLEKLTGVEFNLEKQYDFMELKMPICDGKLILANNDRTGFGGYDLFFPSSYYKDFKKYILELGGKFDMESIDYETYNLLRIEAGIPLFGIDFNSNNILPEVTEKGVSYQKGCFVGQEIVARVKNIAKGVTAKKLVAFEMKNNYVPEINEKVIINKNVVGHVTSAAFSYKCNKAIGFVFVKKGFYDDGTVIEINNSKAVVKKLI